MPPRKRKAVDDSYTGYSSYTCAASYPATAVPGASSNPILVDSSAAQKPAPKRQRKAKDPDAPVPEKRGAIFKKACPKNIIERVERVMQQRFFMIDRRRQGTELKEEFSVLGSTGNVYTVVIDKKPSCTCPDASKGNHCKHILFIFLKVLQVTQKSGYWYQKALLTSELVEIFAEAPQAPAAIAHERIRNAYAQATGKAIPSSSQKSGKKRLPGKEDDCPICYENMHGASETLLVFCEECGNGLHKECFQQWANAAKGAATCVFCRAEWVAPVAVGGSKAASRSAEGYINLAGVAGRYRVPSAY
ncbi:Mitogen-activated protein kinase kinase kinase 1 [Trametes pubescens]|uniref:Mitogen-activated protein kinase kinase kinase 1 n=1 Tax=Trametes pubescens TaxID=154538 RepID=A0A1M2VJP8_TRAPU|nr:Mitogen-activated protein kinase kinase kinase 1 [Trametes pubescens]